MVTAKRNPLYGGAESADMEKDKLVHLRLKYRLIRLE